MTRRPGVRGGVRAGLLLPRWPLLSLLCCSGVVAVATLLWRWGPCASALSMGSLCRTVDVPWLAQAALVWLLFLLVWLLAYFVGGARPGLRDGLLLRVSDHTSLRPHSVAFGVIGAAAVVAMMAAGRTEPAVLALALLPGAVAAWSLVYRSPARAPRRGAQEALVDAHVRGALPLARRRSLPVVRFFVPPRPVFDARPLARTRSRPEPYLVVWATPDPLPSDEERS